MALERDMGSVSVCLVVCVCVLFFVCVFLFVCVVYVTVNMFVYVGGVDQSEANGETTDLGTGETSSTTIGEQC